MKHDFNVPAVFAATAILLALVGTAQATPLQPQAPLALAVAGLEAAAQPISASLRRGDDDDDDDECRPRRRHCDDDDDGDDDGDD